MDFGNGHKHHATCLICKENSDQVPLTENSYAALHSNRVVLWEQQCHLQIRKRLKKNIKYGTAFVVIYDVQGRHFLSFY